MKPFLAIALCFLPLFLFGQQNETNTTNQVAVVDYQTNTKKATIKPWMNHYLYGAHQYKVIPFRYPKPKAYYIPPGTSQLVKSRTAVYNEQLSPMLKKVYKNQLHAQTVNDLRYIANSSSTYFASQNFVTRAVNNLFFLLK